MLASNPDKLAQAAAAVAGAVVATDVRSAPLAHHLCRSLLLARDFYQETGHNPMSSHRMLVVTSGWHKYRTIKLTPRQAVWWVT